MNANCGDSVVQPKPLFRLNALVCMCTVRSHYLWFAVLLLHLSRRFLFSYMSTGALVGCLSVSTLSIPSMCSVSVRTQGHAVTCLQHLLQDSDAPFLETLSELRAAFRLGRTVQQIVSKIDTGMKTIPLGRLMESKQPCR